MGTGLCDLPVCYHQDLVRILDNGQGMGNHHHGLFFSLSRLAMACFTASSFSMSRDAVALVQQQNGTVLQNGPGNGDALALTAREQITILPCGVS